MAVIKRFIAPLSLLAALAVLMVGCGESLPTEAQAIDFINAKSKEEYNGVLKVKSLKKTNGKPGELYEFEYDYEFDCVKSNSHTAEYVNKFQCSKAGDVIKGQGMIYFEKTENGWRPAKSPVSVWW